MKFYLNDSGLFYSCGALINVSKKPKEVSRYVIYDSLEPLKIVDVKKKIYAMKNRQVLEVEFKDGRRIFFDYEDGFFTQKTIKPIDIMEGENEFLRHLGLLGLKVAKHYDEEPL